MRAHKKIILWTFWLSIFFLVGTLILYLFQPENPKNKIFEWMNVITTGILTGLIVSCIVEIGNYLSTRNKLYEKLFSECSTLYKFIDIEMGKLENYMKSVDDKKDKTELTGFVCNIMTTNENQLHAHEQYTKIGDFSFIMISDKNITCKKQKYVDNCIKCMNKFVNVNNEVITLCNYLKQDDIDNSYICALNLYQNLYSLQQELTACVKQLEQKHKFSVSWNKFLEILYIQNTNNEFCTKLNNFRSSANARASIKQMKFAISGLTTLVSENTNIEKSMSSVGNNIQKDINKKKNIKKGNTKT